MTSRQNHSQAGVTLVELMISLVIVSIAVAATFGVGSTLNRSYKEHRSMIAVARVARGSLDYMAEALRNASPGVENGNIWDMVFCNGNSAVEVTNSSAGPDAIRAIWGAGAFTTLTAGLAENSASLSVDDASEFADQDYLVITQPGGTVGHFFQVSVVASPTQIDLTSSFTASPCAGADAFPSTNTYAAGSLVIRARHGEFKILSSALTGNVPTLVFDDDADAATDPELMAQGVEDLQIAVGVDTDGNGSLAESGVANGDDEWFFNTAAGGVETALPAITAAPWRAVRISVGARSVIERSESALSSPSTLEDHTPGAAQDVFRRRVASTVVELRNMKGATQ